MDYEKLALEYHSRHPQGKIGIYNKKPLDTLDDLALAYSPGVAGPCRNIYKDENKSFTYTARGNLIAVVSNGSAVLGLGDIGPHAAKPVMEGKAMLFKHFANIDVFDLEVKAQSSDEFIQIVKSLEPTFGGINLEDIKAPECFYIEEQLTKIMNIPVFHDDQHGTAIITGAAFINAIDLTSRNISQVKVVFNGAGAAGIACANLLETLGVKHENIVVCDSKGVINQQRKDLNKYKKKFATKRNLTTLADAIAGADAFIGVSAPDVLTESMLLSMKKNPIVFALANPDPEIKPELALSIRSDVIIATGRSDYPNQVNNVLGFPYIFRGALDVGATKINEEMKIAAVKAIASLAKEDVPEEVLTVYKDSDHYVFGRDYLIPKPVDHRMLLKVAPAVAKAAMDTGVARVKLNMEEYYETIEGLQGATRRIVRKMRKEIIVSNKIKKIPRVVLTTGENIFIMKAAKAVADTREVKIILLGKREKIVQTAKINGLYLPKSIEIVDNHEDIKCDHYAQELYKYRKSKGLSLLDAKKNLADENYFAAMMLRLGEVDAMVSGIHKSYRSSIKPILQTIGVTQEKSIAGVYLMIVRGELTFFADCSVNIDPSAEELARIALQTAELAKRYTNSPLRVAMLSFASFGSTPHESTRKVAEAVKSMRKSSLGFEVDGEMQVDIALNEDLRKREFPSCTLSGNANILIFPDLAAANIGYKLVANFAETAPIGPIIVGLNKPANVLQRVANVKEIVDMIYVSAHQGISLNK